MIEKIEGIVLSNTKYSDNSLILNLYTLEHGKISCSVKKIRSKKSGFAPSLFFPFTIVNAEIYYTPKKEIQLIKEIGILSRYESLYINQDKMAIVMFLSEVINKTIKFENEDKEFYFFLSSLISELNSLNNSVANFHIYSLINMTHFLGFKPINNFNANNKYFDLMNAQFTNKKTENQTLNTELSELFSKLINTENSISDSIKLSKGTRNLILNKLLLFYKIHTGINFNIKSLNVLNELFS